jgi:hypothetical protein
MVGPQPRYSATVFVMMFYGLFVWHGLQKSITGGFSSTCVRRYGIKRRKNTAMR